MRVVIVGGGFAAVEFATTLRRKLKASECEIMVFSRENHMVFHPLLADVAGASINPDAAAAPLRQMLKGVNCRTERVQRIDLAVSEIEFDDGTGALARLHYDHVVIACGAESNLGIIPGMTDHAFPFKLMRDAVELRQHIVRQMEQAEGTSDPEVRRQHLSFIVVGAGFSGVEVAGEINELVRSSTRFYRNFRKEDVVVTMVHSQEQILPEVAPTLREFARKKMEKAGISMLLNTRAVAATQEGVQLNNGKMLRGATIVCTIGTAISSLVQHLEVPKEKGRIRTTPDMRIEGQSNAWTLGDCAYIINAFDNKPSPTTAQFAVRQGTQAALNLVRVVRGEPTQPFHFKELGQLCSIGGYSAVAEMFGMRVSGFPAWFMWRGVYLLKLPTWSRRIKVALDWSWDLLFPRDLGFLNIDLSKGVTHAYYRAGDFILREGETARYFNIIEEGEVEALRVTDNEPEGKVLSVLGKGDFFGESALLGNRPMDTGIRARTSVRVLQIGSDLFSQLAGASQSFREVLSHAMARRSGDFWRRLPLAKALLTGEALETLLDPLAAKLLTSDTTFADAVTALNDSARGELLILDAQQRLWGTLDRDDLYDMIARIAVVPLDQRGDVTRRRLNELLPGDPVYVTTQDSIQVAVETLLDHGVSWLPVVRSKDDLRPVGVLRGERISGRLIEKLGAAKADHAGATD
jgi:NADH:ubiquinone reductase (H+-translocating)